MRITFLIIFAIIITLLFWFKELKRFFLSLRLDASDRDNKLIRKHIVEILAKVDDFILARDRYITVHVCGSLMILERCDFTESLTKRMEELDNDLNRFYIMKKDYPYENDYVKDIEIKESKIRDELREIIAKIDDVKITKIYVGSDD